MTINKLDSNRVLVTLGNDEMNGFELDFARMSLEDDRSRRVILRLTRLACRKTGIETRGKRLNIEALMMCDGCYLLVTVKSASKQYRRKRAGALCFRFESAGAFLGAVEAAYRHSCQMRKNAAYEWNGAYFLLFSYPAIPKALRLTLAEFGEKHGGALACARVKEHGRLLCPQSAIETIGAKLV